MWRFRQRRRRSVFVCYRRKPTQGDAGRIFDHLASTFGKKNVFRDIESITFGKDFVDAIDEMVSRCDAVLVVIGPNWSQDPRLQNPEDFVRREVAHALRDEVPVIPLLVQDAVMPNASELPPELAALSRINGIVIMDQLFDAALAAITDTLRKLPQRRARTRTQPVKLPAVP